MNTLNSKQQYAVQTPHKKVLIMAGAFTGKTTVLTHRILYLIQHNIKEQDIAAFTFTNKAASQMKSEPTVQLAIKEYIKSGKLLEK